MARDEGEQQAMTSERLAALAERAEHCYRLYVDDDTRLDRDYPDLPHDYYCDVEELLAEVERLRAREAALLAALRLNWMFLDCQECAAWRDVEQALPDVVAALRAAEQQQRSGGDGA